MDGNGAGRPGGSAGSGNTGKTTKQDKLTLAGLLVSIVAVQPLAIPTWLVWGICGLAVALAVLVVFPRRTGKSPEAGGTQVKRLRWKRIAALASRSLAVVLIVALQAWSVWTSLPSQPIPCGHPVELRVLTSPETLPPYRQVAEDYERHAASKHEHGCRAVNMYVYAMPSRKVVTAFAQSWADVTDREPHPDIWLPGSAAEFEEVRNTAEQSTSDAVLFDGNAVVAWSPIVLGVPAGAKLGGERLEASWPALTERVTAAGIRVVRPNPAASVEGESAMLALYHTSGGLIDPAAARGYERRHAEALDEGGYPLEGDTTAVLCRQAETRPTDTAVISSEQALIRFNTALRPTPSCRVRSGCDADDNRQRCLIAYYPKTTPRLEYPFVAVHWSGAWRNTAAHASARAFGTWLAESDGRNALNDAGLRPMGVDARPPISEENGVLSSPALLDPGAAPTAEVREQAFDLYRASRRDGRVLIAVDASGSMNEPVAGGGLRIDVARQGVDQALAHLGPDDEYGLSTFSDQQVRQHLPVAAATDRATVQAVLGGVTPTGGTPLYAMIADGVRTVGVGSPDVLSAVIVLTDGEDTTSGLTATQVVDAVRNSGVRVFVIAIGEAGCDRGPLVDITGSTGGACHDSDTATVGDDLAALFRQLWGTG